ncbi:hypothetical protein BS47DRAFT_1392509 [Hydnum rufescens UP504]|uniref:Uncharacterized protein n=1 Tax=Hydnum rufescens UP504 TaxID=1448309 RepID=A0A9P6AYY3_9AGAM|nr:hypothetical protein BS47DRAFT_1392509 [Hydnum rufescens UP504]
MSDVNFLGKLAQVALVEENNWDDDNSESEFGRPDSKDTDDEGTDDDAKRNAKPLQGESANVPDMETELLNLQAQDVMTTTINYETTLSAMTKTAKKVVLFRQSRLAELKIYGMLSCIPRRRNDIQMDWTVRMKAEYAKLCEGLNADELAAKKDALIKALHEKRGAQDFEWAEEG